MNVKTKSLKKPVARKKIALAKNGHKSSNLDFSGPRDKELELVLTEITAQPDTQRLDEYISVPCPFCGEEFEVHATSEQDGQTISDHCQVCSRAFSLHIVVEDEELQVEAVRS